MLRFCFSRQYTDEYNASCVVVDYMTTRYRCICMTKTCIETYCCINNEVFCYTEKGVNKSAFLVISVSDDKI